MNSKGFYVWVKSASIKDNNNFPTLNCSDLHPQLKIMPGAKVKLTISINEDGEDYEVIAFSNRETGLTLRFETYPRSFPRPRVGQSKSIFVRKFRIP